MTMTHTVAFESIQSVSELLDAATELLAHAACATPRADAELLLADALALPPEHVLASPERHMLGTDVLAVSLRIERRVSREPLAYILGKCRFRGLELTVDPRVMIPVERRTRLLVEVAASQPAGSRVHDVGTGSGAIALAVKHERPDLIVSGSDVSAAAVAVARENAARLGLDVEFIVAKGLPRGCYDLVVANLPYADQAELIEAMPPEVALYQPHIALVTGHDSLDLIRELISETSHGVQLAVEHSPVHAPSVRALLHNATTLRDDNGDERITFGTSPG